MTDEREIVARRRRRQRRIEEAKGSSPGFFSSPLSAVFCMTIALGSVVAFWQGVPSWVLLALGVGAVLIVVLAVALIRARRKAD